MTNICVFSSSSDFIDEKYFIEAKKLGVLIAKYGFDLVYGGGKVGLMGATAQEVHNGGGKVIGIIPQKIYDWNVHYDKCDKLTITSDMRGRKSLLDSSSDAFIALPGGLGTLDEVIEIITLKQLFYHHRPIVLINLDGFFDDLAKMLEKICEEKFAHVSVKELYYLAKNAEDAINYIKKYDIEAAKKRPMKLRANEEV